MRVAEVLSGATSTPLARILRALRRCHRVLRALCWLGCDERWGGAVGCYERSGGANGFCWHSACPGATSTQVLKERGGRELSDGC